MDTRALVPTTRLCLALVTVGLVTLTTVSTAQNKSQESPTFRTSINYVVIPVRVLDADGQFVRNLTAEDFLIREDGKPQTISSFNLVDIPFVAPETLTVAVVAREREPVASNQPAEINGRVYAFVVDDLFLEANDTLKLRNVLRGFIVEKMSANDIGAITLTSGLRSQNFTQERERLVDVVDQVVGAFDPKFDRLAADVYDRRRRATIVNTARWLGAVPDRQKALVVVSPSFSCELVTDMSGRIREDGKVTTCGMMFDAAVRSGVSIYTLDTRGPTVPACATAEFSGERCVGASARGVRGKFGGRLAGARTLAEETGGFAVTSTNSFDRFFDRIIQENSAYYMIGYYSTKNRADGRFREHDVKVTRPNVRVVHRLGYQAPRSQDVRRTAGRASPPLGINERLQELANSPLPAADLPMRLAAVPFRAAPGRASVAVILEMPGETSLTTLDAQSRLNIGISIGLFDRLGKGVGEGNRRIDVNVAPAEGDRIKTHGVRVLSRIAVPAGTYRLWAGATQTPGWVGGSVMTDIDVPDFDQQPLTISGIALGTTAADSHQLVGVGDGLEALLGGQAVASREFPLTGELRMYGEIYARTGVNNISASVVVKGVDGKVKYGAPLQPASLRPGYVTSIPLTQLGPGSYLATIEANSGGSTPLSVSRTIAFRVK